MHVDDGIWLVSFMEYDLGYIDLEEKTLQPLNNPFGPKVSGSDRNYLAPQVGLEPTTLRLTAECSTIELLRSKMDPPI